MRKFGAKVAKQGGFVVRIGDVVICHRDVNGARVVVPAIITMIHHPSRYPIRADLRCFPSSSLPIVLKPEELNEVPYGVDAGAEWAWCPRADP